MKKVILAIFLVAMASGLVSCLSDNVGNKVTFDVPGVVSYNQSAGGITFVTAEGEFATPDFASNPYVSVGDYLMVRAELDYDNQPTSGYYTITVVNYAPLDGRISAVDEGPWAEEDTTYNFPLAQLQVYGYTAAARGVVFLRPGYQAPAPTKPLGLDFKLHIEQDTLNASVYNAYLVAKQTQFPTDAGQNYFTESIIGADLRNTIYTLGTDTTIQNVDIKRLKLNLKYYTGKDNDNHPVYGNYGQAALDIVI
jgi:hypothetical protein